MVLRFLHSLFNAEPESASQFDKAMIQAAIERVVDGTDPRLRVVSHYRRKLRAPVERAISATSSAARFCNISAAR